LDELVFRQARGETTPEEDEQLARWRAGSPEHEAHHRLLRSILRGYTQLERGARVPAPPTTDQIIRARWRMRVLPLAHRGSRARVPLILAGSLAAAAILFVGLNRSQLRHATPDDFGTEDFFTGKAERAVIELRDGTVVRLGPESRLQVGDSREQREVTLTGRAFFAVASMPGRRFTIHTQAGSLTVLGTRFDVEAREQDMRLIVIEGRVAVANQDGRTEVAAGEMSRVLDGKRLPTVPIPNAAPYVEWVGDFLAFQSTPLSEVAMEIERKYRVRVEIGDSMLAGRTITAWFTDRPLADVLRVVCLAAAAHCTVDGDRVRITGP
jgi:ferric-dicitrate binding protein FerR (iron transport regulator)